MYSIIIWITKNHVFCVVLWRWDFEYAAQLYVFFSNALNIWCVKINGWLHYKSRNFQCFRKLSTFNSHLLATSHLFFVQSNLNGIVPLSVQQWPKSRWCISKCKWVPQLIFCRQTKWTRAPFKSARIERKQMQEE